MIISDEQARRAREYLRDTGPTTASCAGCAVPDDLPQDLVERVRAAVLSVPETREDRVEHAREILSGSGISAAEVADKMIARIVSDSLR